MKKMRKCKACIAAGIAFVAMLGGIFVGTRYTRAENATEMQTASSLWESVEGITLEDNVDVPDYMKYGKYSTNRKNPESIKEIRTDEEQNLKAWELNGLMMTSESDNRSISFKNTLDLNGFTRTDEFLTVAPIPSVRGVLDYTEVEFMLQDADDENNYLKIILKNNSIYWAGTKILVETPKNSLSEGARIGFNGYTTEVVGDGTINYEYSDCIQPDNRQRAIKLRYDPNKKVVSVVRESGEIKDLPALDLEKQVGYGKAWKGFKNNRVNLTVTMRDFISQKAQLMILNVCGQGMNGTALVDKDAPVFSFGEEAEVIPAAQVGKNYPLYEAQSLDVVSGKIAYNCAVVSPSGKNVEIVDDCFIPTEGGYYTLTYKATDLVGNVATETFKVLATSALPAFTIEAEQAPGPFEAGCHIPVYEANVQGGSGKLNVTTEIIRVGGGESVTLIEGEFTPILGGTYCVVYTTTDYLGNTATKTLSYKVEQPKTVVVEALTELKRVFDGVPVSFPQPIAYDYVTRVGSKLNAKYEIAVCDKQGAEEVLEDGIFTPDKEKYGDSVTVKYTIYANNDTTKANAYVHTYDVPLYSREADGVATGQIEDYFAYDKEAFTTSYNPDSDSRYVKFYTEQVSTAQSISFVNPVIADGFSLDFALPAGEQNYNSLTISLRDSVDSRIGLDLELKKLDAKRTYVSSGGTTYAMNGAGNTFDVVTGEEISSPTPLSLKYKGGKILDYTDVAIFTPTVNFDGKTFNGFTSGRVYVTVTFNGITDKASMMFARIGTQMLYATYDEEEEAPVMMPFEDIIDPTIVFSSDIKDAYFINQTVEVPAATGYDVLSPYVAVYVTVKDPDGTKIYDNVLATEGLSFELESRGRYTITYEAEDSSENSTRKPFTIRAKDDTAPTVTISATKLQGKVGEKVTLPTALVLDDIDQEPRLYIMIVTPHATIVTLGERTNENAIDSYTFTEKGTYYIRYYALDASYNVTMTDIPVVISR